MLRLISIIVAILLGITGVFLLIFLGLIIYIFGSLGLILSTPFLAMQIHKDVISQYRKKNAVIKTH